MRNVYQKKMIELCEKNPNLYMLLVDSGDKEYDNLRKSFSDRIIECGISEQNELGVAAGMASEGLIPVIYGMSPFLIYRGLEFIRDDICLQNLNVKIIGSGAGIIYNNLGPTHHATEDIGIMRTIPNVKILSPGSPLEMIPILDEAILHEGPTYVRMGKAWEDEIYESLPKELVEEPVFLKRGREICIISTGSIISTCLKVAKLLEDNKISTAVINVRMIKPINEKWLLNKIKDFSEVITVEEHNIVNGLGSLVADIIAKYNLNIKLKKIGFNDKFCTDYGWYQDIKKLNGLGIDEIYKKCIQEI